MLGVPVQYYGPIFLGSVVGYIGGSALSARLSRRFDSEQVMQLGVLLAVTATSLLLLGSYLWPASVLALMLPMVVYSTAMGLVLPHAMAIALRPFAHIAGTASALLGFIQMSLSAAASALTGQFLTTSPAPMVWAMVAISMAALVLGQRAHRLYLRAKS
jgi:DHA1 family bicyclomycin/chloramphenicol resistance-like MFS transporter